ATPKLLRHRGRAVVFESIEDFHKRIDDPKLDIDESCVMVLKNCGPKGYPGMAEVGNMALPAKLLKKGVEDMLRISPEAAAGGNLALVCNGDMIELDVFKQRLHLDVSDAELEKRRKGWNGFENPYSRGYAKLYVDHVLQADKGADFDFLVGKSGTPKLRESH